MPPLSDQARRLDQLGLLARAGVDAAEVVTVLGSTGPGLLVLHPALVPIGELAALVRHAGKPGFVVTDMLDVDAFTPTPEAVVPTASVQVLTDVTRGDDMANWTPDEAGAELVARDRLPLTLSDGLHWLLQQDEVLERNRCFMTIGSRLTKANGRLDTRTPALWISNGTGRDGRERRDAPKVGWCWAGNRHTWLGFASAADRVGLWVS